MSETAALPSIHNRLRALGALTLGEDPAPDVVEQVIRAWVASLNGADPIRVQAERAALVRLPTIPARLVDAALAMRPKPEEEDAGQGTMLALADPEPWPEPVDGAELLDELERTFRRFLVLAEGASVGLSLWTVHTHAHDSASVSPLLAVTSPEKRCGKTTLLEPLSALVPRPLPASNITGAALFRAVESFRPTLLVDEADSFLARSDELRGILNSGHRRSLAFVVRTVGDEHEARLFHTWAPKAIALIGRLPATLADRSIEVRMRRKRPGERVERVRLDRLSELEPLRRKAARWAADNADALRAADPDVPAELHDRAADNWRPLLAIADLAGGEWPGRARKAALLLSGLDDDAEGAGVQLLADLKGLFEQKGAEQIASAAIVSALVKMEERPWPEWRRGNPITTRQLAQLFKPFDIRPRQIRLGEMNVRGYRLADFIDAFARYLPPDPLHVLQGRTSAPNGGFSIRYKGGDVADPKPTGNPQKTGDVADVADREGDLSDEQYLIDEREGMRLP